MDESKAPAISDPRWATWSKPLQDLLAHPCNWKVLNGWCREKQFGAVKLRHCLAWLETFGHIRSFVRDDVLYWVSTAYHGEEAPSPSHEREASLPPGAPEPSVYDEDEEPPPSEPSMQN